MKNRVDKIYDYISYLNKTYNIKISLHPMCHDNLICDTKLLDFNTHDNLFCHYIKNSEQSFKNCLHYQRELFNSMGNESLSNTCYAGITEYVYPFKGYDKIMGYISVGSFKTKNSDNILKKVSYDYCLNYNTLKTFYDSFRDDLPDKETIDILIEPLCDMLELAYNFIDNSKEADLNVRILNYIDLNYRRKLTIEEISQKFFISYSTISHKFKKYAGISINDYINKLRIDDAKNLLTYTNLTVTEIADTVGFSGVNYFINVFTKAEKISPSKFRKSIQKE